MKVLLALVLIYLVSSCCPSSCNCDEYCNEPYLFQFDTSSSGYRPSDLDTLIILYKFEGQRYFDSIQSYLINGKYYPGSACADSKVLALEKNYPDSNGKLLRVDVYKVYTAIDSFRVDRMDLLVTKSGNHCCRCVSTTERTFFLDSVKYFQNSLSSKPVTVYRK
ncbi:MAG: hypothetical protein GC180_03505 [Bacteroidetes bacterium]|nr:hypothetical protein [Bacteroidota bacterium]